MEDVGEMEQMEETQLRGGENSRVLHSHGGGSQWVACTQHQCVCVSV